MDPTNDQPIAGDNQPANSNQNEPTQGSTYNPPATQADLDRIIENRLQRERAKYADYNDLKKAADEANTVKDELEQLKSKMATLKAENETYKHNEQVANWASEVSAETGVPAELLQGDTKEAMEEQAKVLSKYLNPSAPVVSGDGKSPNAQAGMATRDIFANALEGII